MLSSQAQDSILTFKKFIRLVKEHNPVSAMADLKLVEGQAYLTYYRGFFDPKLLGNIDAKFFNKKEYYNKKIGQLKVPTWFGLELNAGIEHNKGKYLNPEKTVPENGLVFAGAKITLGQGLITDERRTMLRKAILIRRASQLQRQQILNDLILQAGKAYWEWFYAYNELQIRKEALELTITRLNAVKTEFTQGFRSAMDTLEAKIQVQNRQILLQEAEMKYKTATNNLGNFLWYDAKIPLEIPENTIPQSVEQTIAQYNLLIQDTSTISVRENPELLQYANKIRQLDFSARWQREQLKPVLNLKYNFLAVPFGNEWYNNFNINNYKWAVEFSSPLFLRKQRGKLKLINTKIQTTELKFLQKEQQLKIKAHNYIVRWNITTEQIETLRQYIENYYNLLQGEKTLFRIGESSLFKLNSRELKYVEARLKLMKQIANSKKIFLGFYHTLGNLYSYEF